MISKIDPPPLAIYIITESQAEASYIFDYAQSGGGVSTSGIVKFHWKTGFDISTNFKWGVCTVPPEESYEAMAKVRYATGAWRGKYQLLKEDGIERCETFKGDQASTGYVSRLCSPN
jgi:hypothetical protein